MRFFCTYFDAGYLTRGLALHASLARHAGDFSLAVLCMDAAVEADLRRRNLPGVRLLPLEPFVAKYPALAAARGNRTKLEFYFTCTSWLMHHLLVELPPGELLTYLDADLCFYGPPDLVFAEIGSASVAITPHRFPSALAHLERYGRFNVGWVSLRHDATGQACARDWADKCADWCYNQLEPERYADQKYLDAWVDRFPVTVSLEQKGVNFAPWNARDCIVSAGPDGPLVDGAPLVFYHFHALVHLGRGLYDPSLHRYDATLTDGLRDLVYLPYLRELHQIAGTPLEPPELLPPADPRDDRNGLALPHLLRELCASELDRARRLSAIEMNRAATAQTIAYLKVVEADRDRAQRDLDRTVEYLRAVEKDSADRLASIQFYQEKLQTAYADLERNVKYLKTLEAEIAAHVKAAAEREAMIADLSHQLQQARQVRQPNP
ncbi:MAG: hypothetical protein KF897_11495 [Opitutaceae bacterium]|nr:hypothetical protein [Opitutaceae bacterium]